MQRLIPNILLLLVVAVTAAAQEIRVKSFGMQMDPMSVAMQRKDFNGDVCALVKVIIPDSRAAFEGDLVGDCEFKTSEYWCYLPPGSKQLRIKYPGCEPLRVNFADLIGSGLQGSRIYELVIQVPHPPGGENLQKIRTLNITVRSSISWTGYYARVTHYAKLENVKISRFSNSGILIDTFTYNKAITSWLRGEYSFDVGAIQGDKFEVSAFGYKTVKFGFENPEQTIYNVTLYPKERNFRFLVLDKTDSEPLIGVNVFRNPEFTSSLFAQKWDNQTAVSVSPDKYDQATVSDFNGMTPVFNGIKTNDEFRFEFVGLKPKTEKVVVESKNFADDTTYIVYMEPYDDVNGENVVINLGGMGINDHGKVTVTNTRSGETFTMSQKTHENHKTVRVKHGDELTFSRKGYRTVSARFKHHIPERINIGPVKGNQSDIQYVEY